MANQNAPYGLKPVNEFGAPWVGRTRLVNIPANQPNIFIGDPLVPVGGTDAWGVPKVGIASAGATDRIVGAFLGLSNGPQGSQVTLLQSSPIYFLTGTANYALITDDPSQCFSIQEDSVGGAIAVTTGGYANGNLIAGAGGSTATGLSSWMLDSSTVASGNATFQVKVLGLDRGPDNAIGNFARWIVSLNLPALAPNTTGF